MAKDIYSTLVIECGLSPQYIFDVAPMYEINLLMKNAYKKAKETWEQTRMLGYIQAQTQSTKKMKPSDIIKFPWDNEKETHNTSISNDDVKKLREKANEYKKRFNG